MSGHIRKLTDTVGLPLLEQVGKRVHPTAAGRELSSACRDIFSMLERVEGALADLRGLKGGTLRVASGTAGKRLAARLLAAFAETHPEVEVSLHVNCRRELLARLADNADDLYLFANPPEDSQVVAQRILPNPLVTLARADHPLAREKAIPFSRFAQESVLIREPGSGTRLMTERLFARHGLAPNIRMELGSDEAIVEAILAGLGVSILSRHARFTAGAAERGRSRRRPRGRQACTPGEQGPDRIRACDRVGGRARIPRLSTRPSPSSRDTTTIIAAGGG